MLYFLSSFLFALYYQGAWGGKPQLVLPPGTEGTLSRRANCSASDCLRSESSQRPAHRGWGVVTRRAQGSGIPLGHRGAWSPGGQAEEKDSAGAESVLGAPGLASYVASLPSRPFLPTLARIPWPRLCARDLSRVPLEWASQSPGNRLTFPGCPGQN